jgi:hypothetical protein
MISGSFKINYKRNKMSKNYGHRNIDNRDCFDPVDNSTLLLVRKSRGKKKNDKFK